MPPPDADGDGVMNSADVDDDNDGLIEIYNLDMFSNIRLNLAGTSYNSVTTGGPTSATTNCPIDPDGDMVFLCGYELMTNLDFADESSYVSGSTNWTNKTWRPVDEVTPDSSSTDEEPDSAVNAGFPGIGAASGNTGGFNAIFEGNGKIISNFYSRNTAGAGYTGLFRSTDSTAQIRSLGVTNGNVYGGTGGGDNVGVLAGVNRGSIIASSASGSADGGDGNQDNAGGLVGYNNNGRITASYATGSADGGAGDEDRVGGLVGFNDGGTITASYATGDGDDATTSDADGGGGNQDDVGGLVEITMVLSSQAMPLAALTGEMGFLTGPAAWWELTQAPSPQAMPLAALTGEMGLVTLSVNWWESPPPAALSSQPTASARQQVSLTEAMAASCPSSQAVMT